MKSRQQGFTMIELIVVIVILGVLAATALPRFIDMRGDAEQAAVNGVAGAAASAMSLNFGGCSINNHVPAANRCTQISTCAGVGPLMQGGSLPTNYTAAVNAAGVDLTTTNGNNATCRISRTVGATTYVATFNGIAAGN